MEPDDIILFLFLAVIGVVCGALVAVLAHRSAHPYLWTAGAAPLSATFFGLLGGMA